MSEEKISKFIPAGSNWKKVLLEIYSHSPHQYSESNKVRFDDDRHILARNLKISGYELMLAISFLRENKLIKDSPNQPLDQFNPSWTNPLYLTEKGFEVASKLEEQENSQRTQNVIIIFAAITAFTGFISLIKEIIKIDGKKIFWIYCTLVLILLFSFYFKSVSLWIQKKVYNWKLKRGKILI